MMLLSPASPEEIIGDPTEGALIPLAQDFGYSVSSLRKEYPRLGEYPLIQLENVCLQFMK